MEYPKIIKERLDALEKLCEEYPQKIPLSEAAEFMGVSVASMRNGIAKGVLPFAIYWTNDRFVGKGKTMVVTEGRAVLVIPTLPFYFYMTGQFAQAKAIKYEE